MLTSRPATVVRKGGFLGSPKVRLVVGGRLQLPRDEFERLAPPGPRLRAAPRRLRSHDPYRPRIPPAQANCQLNRILKRTLRGLLLEVSYMIYPISPQDCLL